MDFFAERPVTVGFRPLPQTPPQRKVHTTGLAWERRCGCFVHHQWRGPGLGH